MPLAPGPEAAPGTATQPAGILSGRPRPPHTALLIPSEHEHAVTQRLLGAAQSEGWQVLEALQASAEGLPAGEACRRLQQHGHNIISSTRAAPWYRCGGAVARGVWCLPACCFGGSATCVYHAAVVTAGLARLSTSDPAALPRMFIPAPEQRAVVLLLAPLQRHPAGPGRHLHAHRRRRHRRHHARHGGLLHGAALLAGE